MGLIDAVGLLFPSLAGRYLVQRFQFQEAKRLFEAASSSNYRPGRLSHGDGDRLVQQAGTRLRAMSRHLDENHDLVVGLFDDLVNNTVGDGIGVDPMVLTKDRKLHVEFNAELARLYVEWCDAPETTGELTMVPAERMIARSLFRDGEMFLQMVRDPQFRYQTRVPFVLDMLEADFCPLEYTDPGLGVMQGVQRSAWGTPLNYFFFKQHPGAWGSMSTQIALTDLVRKPAGSILHPKMCKRLKQGRGVPVIHAVINRLRDVKDYEESERIAAKVAADMTGFIQRNMDAGAGAARIADGKRQMRMTAGMIYELGPGETIGTLKSDRPNTGLEAFRNAMLRAVAAGTGTRFSSIARSYDGTYSAQRQELVEGVVAYRALFAYLVGAVHSKMWRAFVETAVLGGLVKVPAGIDRATLSRAEFRAPALPWIDPLKEAEAWASLVTNELESRAGVQRMRGRDPERVFAEIEAERERGFGINQTPAPAPALASDGSAAKPDQSKNPAADPSADPNVEAAA